MANLQDALFNMFPATDHKVVRNKHGNFEVVLSPEAAEHLAKVMNDHDPDREFDWGKL